VASSTQHCFASVLSLAHAVRAGKATYIAAAIPPQTFLLKSKYRISQLFFSSKCIDNVTPTAFGMKFQNFDTGTFCRKETNLAEIRYSRAEQQN